jgi:DNA-binding NarL/FixJ family response regulator
VLVLPQVALDRFNKVIATALAVSDETVKTHVGRVLAKLHVENRAQAIVRALERGLVRLGDLL